jgi:DNA-directed RNA polymerase specialized sigma24 family protein
MAKNHCILETARQREILFMALYKKAFPNVAHYVARMGGSLEEAQDIFQDTLVIYYEKIISAPNNTVVSESAYLLGIAKNLWLRRYKAENKNKSFDDFDIEAIPDKEPAADKLLYYLETAGKKCMELLKAYYYDNLKVDNIATLFGYSGTHSATVAKYTCLEKVRETIKEKSLTYADFIE